VTYLDFHRWIVVYALAAVRIGVAFSICPALSDSMITGLARRVMVLAFSLLAVPLVARGLPPGEPSVWFLAVTAAKEAVIGLLIGFAAAAPFWIAENVGNFIDNQRGATMGEVYSPLSGTQVSTMGIFFTQLVSTVFVVSGAFVILLGVLYSSYSIWPMFAQGISFQAHAPAAALAQLDGLLRQTVVISAPVIILMFLATVGLGFVNRTAPQLNVFFLSMPVKSALGIALLVLYIPYIMDMLMYTQESQVLKPVLELING